MAAKREAIRRSKVIRSAVQQIACARTREQAADALRVASRTALQRAADWAESEEEEDDDDDIIDIMDVVGDMPRMLGVARPGSAGSINENRNSARPVSAGSMGRGQPMRRGSSREEQVDSRRELPRHDSSESEGGSSPVSAASPSRAPRVRRPSGRDLTQSPNVVGS